jgi:two-component system, NtrC family, sensor histidine kinase AtoS
MSTATLPPPMLSVPPGSTSAPAGTDTIAAMQAAFETFARQSHQLETAYQSLKEDLARSNRALQERNRQLVEKNLELARLTGKHESVMQSLTDGIMAIATDSIVERCNIAAATILDRMDLRVEGTPLSDHIDNPQILAGLERVLAGGPAVLDYKWLPLSPQGETREVLVSVAPVMTAAGQTIGAVCHLRDNTELRRLQKRLQSHERLAALGEMAASVAHEIRNPLGTIEGFARLLRRDLADMPEHLRLAEKIVAGAQNLNYVITNLLTYARPMQLQMAPVSVTRLIENCRETLENIADRHQVALSLTLPETDISLAGDARQLGQAILNLGINAIEACPSQGKVDISVSKTKRSVLIRIQDNGCGMSEDTLERIFDPFFTRKEGGTGLGLSLTRKIIDAHGGDIRVTSVPDKGTEFILEMDRTGTKS